MRLSTVKIISILLFLGILPGNCKYFRIALKINPDNYTAYYNWGYALYMQGRVKEAIEKYIKTIKVNPDFPDAYYNIAEAYIYLKEYKLAKKNLEHYLTIGKNPLRLEAARNTLKKL